MAARLLLVLAALVAVASLAFYAGRESAISPAGHDLGVPETVPPPPHGRLALPPGDAARAFQAALVIPDPVERLARVAAVLETLGPEDAAAIQATIQPRLGDLTEVEVGLFLQWWALGDPQAAFAWARLHLPQVSEIFTSLVVMAWAQNDFEAARAFVETRPTGASTRLRVALVRGAYDAGVPGLADYIAGFENSVSQQAVLYALAKRLVIRGGSQAATEWAEALPDDDPDFKLHAVRRVARALAVFDSPAGRAWAEKHRFGEYSSFVLEMVARNEARRGEPRETVAWLVALPAGPDLDSALREAFAAWLSRDPEAAAAWVDEQGSSPRLDGVRIIYVTRVLDSEGPEAAFAMVDDIQDEDARRRALGGVVVRWLRQNPDAAEAWIATADLDDELLASIRKRTVGER